MEREYAVTVHADVDLDQFDAEMIASTGAGAIPNRTVDVANQRSVNKRTTHYALTSEEAKTLKDDPRVLDVEIPHAQDDDLIIEPLGRQTGNFTKTSSSFGDNLNWGMRRSMSRSDPYFANNPPSGDYTYNLDGKGVDVVIQDTGIVVGHPEFDDADGNSRIQQINWFTESGVSGTLPSNFYSDQNGHGSHVAGTVAGLRYGWAKSAHIYAQKIDLGIPNAMEVDDGLDAILGWHNNKTSNRPTIVNMSWGYGRNFGYIDGGNYRGTNWTGNTRQTQYGMIGSQNALGYRYGVRSTSIDVAIEQMISAGIHICIAAGNSRQKIELPGRADYDNYYWRDAPAGLGGRRASYYHRGGSPFSENAMMVGALDFNYTQTGMERKAAFSECGPGVTLYAPGRYIRSAYVSNNGVSYYWDSNFYQRSISGTSMASPQVAGVGACILQAYPDLTPAELRQRIIDLTSRNYIYDTGLNNDYTNNRSLIFGQNRLLYFPYTRESALTIT